MTTCLGKSCSFGLPRVPFLNCCQFMYLVISLLVLWAGCGVWLYQFLIIANLFTFQLTNRPELTKQSSKLLQFLPIETSVIYDLILVKQIHSWYNCNVLLDYGTTFQHVIYKMFFFFFFFFLSTHAWISAFTEEEYLLHPHKVCQSLEKLCKVHILNASDHDVFNKISLLTLKSLLHKRIMG